MCVACALIWNGSLWRASWDYRVNYIVSLDIWSMGQWYWHCQLQRQLQQDLPYTTSVFTRGPIIVLLLIKFIWQMACISNSYHVLDIPSTWVCSKLVNCIRTSHLQLLNPIQFIWTYKLMNITRQSNSIYETGLNKCTWHFKFRLRIGCRQRVWTFKCSFFFRHAYACQMKSQLVNKGAHKA